MRTSNKNARNLVENRVNFKGSHTFGRWENDTCYVVYSYGTHFPMFVYISGKGWYRNRDKYSRSTSRHQSQLRPLSPVMIFQSTTNELKKMIADSDINTGKSEYQKFVEMQKTYE